MSGPVVNILKGSHTEVSNFLFPQKTSHQRRNHTLSQLPHILADGQSVIRQPGSRGRLWETKDRTRWSLSPRSSPSGARILRDDMGSTMSVTREGQCQEGLGMAGKTPGANLKKMSRNEAAEREKPGG